MLNPELQFVTFENWIFFDQRLETNSLKINTTFMSFRGSVFSTEHVSTLTVKTCQSNPLVAAVVTFFVFDKKAAAAPELLVEPKVKHVLILVLLLTREAV